MRQRTIMTLLVLTWGCGGAVYKDALCKLSSGSDEVASHYAEYVEKEVDPDTKAARQAESEQFAKAVAEAKLQCSN
jgi:predicted  nucleic acid-binding Zn-ribbon protein